MAEFRKGLYGVVTAAAVAAAAITSSAPASAQQAAQSKPQVATTAPEECKVDYSKTGSDVDCKFEALKRSQRALQESQKGLQESQKGLQESQARGRELDKDLACIGNLKEYKARNPDMWKDFVARLVAAKGKDVLQKDLETNPCGIVAVLPKKTAAVGQSAVLRQ